MSGEQFEKLIEYIDARIDEHNAQDSSDGGLLEEARTSRVRAELRALLVEQSP